MLKMRYTLLFRVQNICFFFFFDLDGYVTPLADILLWVVMAFLCVCCGWGQILSLWKTLTTDSGCDLPNLWAHILLLSRSIWNPWSLLPVSTWLTLSSFSVSSVSAWMCLLLSVQSPRLESVDTPSFFPPSVSSIVMLLVFFLPYLMLVLFL